MKKAKWVIHKKGFTLAEVLITLAIIGVIGAMTIPSLIQGQQEKATVTAVKKAYSTLSNAYKLAEQENGTPDTWGFSSSWKSMLSNLAPYLSVIKDCTNGTSGCFPPSVMYKYLGPSKGNYMVADDWGSPALKLADGTLILGYGTSSSCIDVRGSSLALQNVCGEYFVDVNGYKAPNQVGKDFFYFYLTKYGIVPLGTAQDSVYSFSLFCKDKDNAYGDGCAAWIIYNENLDYLHCKTLDWNGPTKCP